MPPHRSLRAALLANALFAFSTGILVLAAPATVARVLRTGFHPILVVIAGGLIVFALDLAHQATRPRIATWRAAYATALDLGWVAGTVVLLSTRAVAFTTTGVALIATIAVVVLGFAVWQAKGIDDAHRVRGTHLRRHCVRVQVDRPAESMWEIIADLGAIQRYMPSLVHSTLDGGSEPGRGAVRTCVDRNGRSWSEACIGFEPGELALRFATEAEDFPFPASEMYGGWKVEPDDHGCRVTVWWALRPRPDVLAPLIMPIFAFRADRQISKVVRRMAADVEVSRSDVGKGGMPAAPRVRTLHAPCASIVDRWFPRTSVGDA
ncbi:MAG: SRPBCC family protein [Trueperaceae bacterium]